MALFRYGIGVDYFNYEAIFILINESILEELLYPKTTQEVGFRLILAIFKSLNMSYEIVSGIFALVTFIYLWKIYKNYSSNMIYSFFIYFSMYYTVWMLSGIRQGIVIAIGMYYLLEALKKQKVKRFYFMVLILTTIHTSAIMFIILYFLARMKMTRDKFILIIIFVLIIMNLPIANLLSKIQFLWIVEKIIPYISNEFSIIGNFDIQLIMRLFFVLCGIYIYSVYSKDEFNKKLIDIYLWSFVIYFIFKSSELVAARLLLYGRMLDTIIFVNYLYMIKNKHLKIILNYLLILLMLFFFLKELNSMKLQSEYIDDDAIFVPYSSILEKED